MRKSVVTSLFISPRAYPGHTRGRPLARINNPASRVGRAQFVRASLRPIMPYFYLAYSEENVPLIMEISRTLKNPDREAIKLSLAPIDRSVAFAACIIHFFPGKFSRQCEPDAWKRQRKLDPSAPFEWNSSYFIWLFGQTFAIRQEKAISTPHL